MQVYDENHFHKTLHVMYIANESSILYIDVTDLFHTNCRLRVIIVKCPYCDIPDSKVTDSRTVGENVRRRRECIRCGLRFTTYERVQTTALLVVKRDERRQEFNRDKLLSQIVLACTKRPIPYRDIEKVVEDIEGQLLSMGRPEIKSSAIGEMVMERLRSLDRIAYIRWASVYRDFQDMESFEEMVKDLRGDSANRNEEEHLSLLTKKVS